MAQLMLRVNPKSTTEAAAAKLMAAGMRKTSPTGFIASKGIFAIGGAVAGLLLGTAFAPKYVLLLLLFMGVAGFAAPGHLRQQQSRARARLPSRRSCRTRSTCSP